ncbi:GTP-binding protein BRASSINAZOLE INSENSITIVE PALE GREEN 2 like [Actinidia chinensis var. chinensis]|uniref:GTP-binding protein BRASSINAZOLE INSENSITIVE PALE GREEN 2 like n=1 Tax=Actinidia chinensis var. chinensis TaxID=1590841 RepID=A0A2R6QVC1_ACTCC|nr:GTP-binding protein BRASSINAZOLE INSENSITIVE PALE GREEN 2 like [Actinidia chinensis var. chinensis]
MSTILSTAILTMSNLAQKTFHTSSFEGKPSPTLPLFTGFDEEEVEGILDEIDGEYEESDEEEVSLENEDDIVLDMEEWDSELEDEGNDLEEWDGFAPACVGYENITEEIVNKGNKKRLSKAEKRRLSREAKREKKKPLFVPVTILRGITGRSVCHCAKAGGAPKLSGVYLNAAKTTLINAFAKKEEVKVMKLAEAAVPATTLGILIIGGILSAKAKLYDIPGLLHPYLMSLRLNREENKMVEIRKELQPRTYWMKTSSVLSLKCWDIQIPVIILFTFFVSPLPLEITAQSF